MLHVAVKHLRKKICVRLESEVVLNDTAYEDFADYISEIAVEYFRDAAPKELGRVDMYFASNVGRYDYYDQV